MFRSTLRSACRSVSAAPSVVRTVHQGVRSALPVMAAAPHTVTTTRVMMSATMMPCPSSSALFQTRSSSSSSTPTGSGSFPEFTDVMKRLPHRAAMINVGTYPGGDLAANKTQARGLLTRWEERSRIDQLQTLWLEIPTSKGAFIETAGDMGWQFHQAEGGVAKMIKWLGEGACAVPPFATHHVGVAGLVLNNDNQVLLVKDRHSAYRRWKLPGGLADVGEEIPQTAAREVFEETGIKAEFRSIVGFRHMVKRVWGRSDIYIVCRMHALTTEINADHKEIEDCCWMPLKEYAELNESHAMNAFVAQETLRGVTSDKGDGSPLSCDIVESMLYSDLYKMNFRFYSTRPFVPAAGADTKVATPKPTAKP